MRKIIFLFYVLLSGAWAVDFTEVNRTIVEEPTYTSGDPQYCLLLFGKEIVHKVWLVKDGGTLYIDRNGNGNLTEEGEKITANQEQSSYEVFASGPLTFKGEEEGFAYEEVKAYFGKNRPFTRITVSSKDGKMQMNDYRMQFSSSLEEAPILHFDGPLMGRLATKGKFGMVEHFSPGEEKKLSCEIGTSGWGDYAFTAIYHTVYKKGVKHYIPLDYRPLVQLEHVFGDEKKGESWKSEVVLERRC